MPHDLAGITERTEERTMLFDELKKASIRVYTICQNGPKRLQELK